MTLPRKRRGFRPITVASCDFMWRFSDRLDIRSATSSGRIVIDTGWQDPWVDSPERAPNDPSIITPGFVEQAIRFALADGWAVDSDRALQLEYRNGSFAQSGPRKDPHS